MSATIRPATASDLTPIAAIMSHYVLHTNVTFDEEVWEPERKRAWFEGYAKRGPHQMWVAQDAQRLIGLAYSSRYREHPAFRETVETSIYVAPEARGRGTGSALYQALLTSLSAEPVHRAVVGIALPNPASVALHRKFGFREVGVFDQYALKRDVRISSVWMEKAMREPFASAR